MPTINLTNNANLTFAATSADDNASLNRYLRSTLTLKAPPTFDPIANLLVKEQEELAFPITLSAAAEAKFAVEKTTLDVQAGASASIGLVKGGESDFLSSLDFPRDSSSSGLVSLSIQAKVSAGDEATAGDFTFGIGVGSTATLTGYYPAPAEGKLVDAIQRAADALAIPHDIDDLKGFRPGAICSIEGANSLTFMASATYSFLNNPLATIAINKLPSLGIQATASATIEGIVTHTSGHTLTIAKLPDGKLHLAVSLKKTDDFETSLTVSSGVATKIGNTDALAFLLDKINPNSAAEAEAIGLEMKNAAEFKADIKSAIDKTLTTSLGASLKAGLDVTKTRNRAFLFEIDLDALDSDGEAALKSALTGDFTGITKERVALNGIYLLDSVLTITKDDAHTITLHLLGIFNASSIHEFVVKSKIDITTDTREIVLSDERIEIEVNNLKAEKLRKLVLKNITLTLPASANTKEADTPITLAYLNRQGSASPATMRQFANALAFTGASASAGAASLLAQHLKHYGVCGLYFALKLNPEECHRLFVDPNGKAHDQMYYIHEMSSVERAIYAGLETDREKSYHWKVFQASPDTWKALIEAGSAANIARTLKSLGMSEAESELATTDTITAIWWSQAMANYAAALTKGRSVETVGKDVVKDANIGYDEPWMILTTWILAGRPTITVNFSSSLQAAGAAGK